jgi:peroxin-1
MYVHDVAGCLVLVQQVSIDTHYVDVSRYSDRPTPTVKALLRYWFDKVAWHRPSVLVLDNLDKLLSAELEVKNEPEIAHR